MVLQVEPAYIADPTFDHPAELDRNLLEGLFQRSGGIRFGDFALSVGVGTRAIAVAPGRYFILGTENAEQGGYFVWSDSIDTRLLGAAVGNPRIDTFVLRVHDNQYGVIPGAPTAVLDVVQGVAAGSPVARADSDFNVGGSFYVPGAWARLGDVRVNVADTGSIPAGQVTTRNRYVRGPGGMVMCLSTDRPSDPVEGDTIYETDTKSMYAYNATAGAWRWIGPAGNTKGINNSRATDTITSASFTNLTGTHSLSFTKISSVTHLRVTAKTSQYVAGTNTAVEIAVQMNSVDRVVDAMQYPNTLERIPMVGVAYFTAAEVPVGAHTARVRWRRVSGSGTPTAAATDDWLTLSIEEVAPPI